MGAGATKKTSQEQKKGVGFFGRSGVKQTPESMRNLTRRYLEAKGKVIDATLGCGWG